MKTNCPEINISLWLHQVREEWRSNYGISRNDAEIVVQTFYNLIDPGGLTDTDIILRVWVDGIWKERNLDPTDASFPDGPHKIFSILDQIDKAHMEIHDAVQSFERGC
jgi:hypothetical protein